MRHESFTGRQWSSKRSLNIKESAVSGQAANRLQASFQRLADNTAHHHSCCDHNTFIAFLQCTIVITILS